MNVQEKVIAILEEQLGFTKGEVSLYSTKDSLGMDSLDEIETIMGLEEEFDIEIKDYQAEKLSTVEDIVDFIKVNQLCDTMSEEAYNDAKEVLSDVYKGKSIHDVAVNKEGSYRIEGLEEALSNLSKYWGNIAVTLPSVIKFQKVIGTLHKEKLYNPVKDISYAKYLRCTDRLPAKMFNSDQGCLWMYKSSCRKYYYWEEYNCANKVIYRRGEVDWVESNYGEYSVEDENIVEINDFTEHNELVKVVPVVDEYTGSSVNYYKLKVENPTTLQEPYEVECNDIIEALDMNYAEANVFKAVWRKCAAKKFGIKKKGYDNGLYDSEKVVFFGERMVIQSKNNG